MMLMLIKMKRQKPTSLPATKREGDDEGAREGLARVKCFTRKTSWTSFLTAKGRNFINCSSLPCSTDQSAKVCSLTKGKIRLMQRETMKVTNETSTVK